MSAGNTTITITPHSEIEKLRKVCGDGFEYILPIVVRTRKDDETLVGCFGHVLGNTPFCVDIPLKLRIYHETRFWVDLLTSRSDVLEQRLSQACPTLFDIYKHNKDFRVPFGRTVRMLLFIQELFTGKLSDSLPPIVECAEGLREKANDLRGGKLDEAIEKIENCTIPIPHSGGWSVSLALLMLTAVRYSQGEYFGGHIWEHFSAGRALDELSRRLPEKLNCRKDFLSIVSHLIRYQSAPGQCIRQSGTREYQRLSLKGLKDEELSAAINVMGLVEEARNHRLPGTKKDEKVGQLKVNDGVDREWDSTDW